MNNALGFLLLCFTVLGDTSADDPLQRVQAYVGLPAIFPCQQKLPKGAETPTIEWSKPGLRPEPYVFVYRRNCEIPELKHQDYEFRTHLFVRELHHGNFAMRLSDVRETDAGTYLCKTIQNEKQVIKKVELVVGHVPTPKLSVVSSGGGAVNLSCQVNACFTTATRLTFSDGDGNPLKAGKVKMISEDESGCHDLEQQITVPTGAKSVVCRAEFPEISQSRDAHMLIPEDTEKSCTVPMVITGIGVFLISVLTLVGVGGLIIRFCRKPDEKKTFVRQSTDETITSNESENQHLLSQRPSLEVAIQIPESHPDSQNTLTSEPQGLSSSTPNSTVSKADSSNVSVFECFPDVTDNDAVGAKPAACEMNAASKSVKYTKKADDKRKMLTRQNASADDGILPQNNNSKSAITLPNGSKLPAKKCPVTRSKSVSDSCSVAVGELKTQCRRYSLSVLKTDTEKTLLLKLPEEPEQDGLPSKVGRQE